MNAAPTPTQATPPPPPPSESGHRRTRSKLRMVSSSDPRYKRNGRSCRLRAAPWKVQCDNLADCACPAIIEATNRNPYHPRDGAAWIHRNISPHVVGAWRGPTLTCRRSLVFRVAGLRPGPVVEWLWPGAQAMSRREMRSCLEICKLGNWPRYPQMQPRVLPRQHGDVLGAAVEPARAS
jgi:hypothetical protein